MKNNNHRSWFQFISILFALAIPASALAAPILIGTGTLNSENDLTIIQDGVTTYQFLDLTPTYGQSVAAAVSTFSGQGFHWATGTEIAVLFGAFNINYGMTPNDYFFPYANASDTANLASYLGYSPAAYIPGEKSALGWVDDNTVVGNFTYACISQCYNDTFVFNTDYYSPPNPQIGTFLVSTTTVPVPPAAWLLVSGLLSLIGVVRKRKTT